MKRLNTLKWFGLCALLFSFTPEWGGEFYEIYANGKMVAQEFLTRKAPLPSLLQADLQGQLSVYYNHCGHIGTSRKVAIRNKDFQVLKEWTFNNDVDRMIIETEAIQSFFKSERNSLNLFYTSKELPQGRMLATLELTSNPNTVRNNR